MRYFYLLAVASLLLSARSAADVSDSGSISVSQAVAYTATVRAGSPLTVGTTNSADILVNNRLAIRIAAPAAKLSPVQRALVIAKRMNHAFRSGASWSQIRVMEIGNEWTVTLGNEVIATADARSAWLMGISTGELASHWARQSVVALGGRPDEIELQLQPATSLVAGSAQEYGNTQIPVIWTTTTTKRIPLLDAASGDEMGFVMVAGAQEQLDTTTCVLAVKAQADSGAVIYTFMPVVGPKTTIPILEVRGVGVISIPESMIPISDSAAGNSMNSMITQYNRQWDTTIKTARSNYGLSTRDFSRIIPLFSAETGIVVAAVEAIGDDAIVKNARSMVAIKSDGMLNLNASLSSDSSLAAVTAPLANVVVSSVIMITVPETTMAPLDAEPYPYDELSLPAPPIEEQLNNYAP